MSILVDSLPLLTADLPGISGQIKCRAEDFEVEEIPAYAPSGKGEFLYLWVEKRELGAEFFLRQVSKRLEVPLAEIGAAGLKDRHAVTRQMISVPDSCEPLLDELNRDGIHLLSVSRHSNKLKPGHLHGNRFNILIRHVHSESAERLPALLQRLRTQGVPNFYGPQRFGREGETLQLGLELFRGNTAKRVNPFLRRLALSAVQSALFNHYVAARLRDGLFRTVLPGDVMLKWPFGGMFVVQDVPREQERFERREIIPGGPMFGKKMFKSAGPALERELQTLQAAELSLASFQGFGKLLSGTRRYSLIYLDDLDAVVEAEGVRLRFTLPAGSYATVVLRELMHTEQLQADENE